MPGRDSKDATKPQKPSIASCLGRKATWLLENSGTTRLHCDVVVQSGGNVYAASWLDSYQHWKPKARAARLIGPTRKEFPLSRIKRREFLSLTAAVLGGGAATNPGRRACADELKILSPDDPTAAAVKYTHDASTVDPSTRANFAPYQVCENCGLIQGMEGDEWRPCQIFPGKLVAAKGWCSVWAPMM